MLFILGFSYSFGQRGLPFWAYHQRMGSGFFIKYISVKIKYQFLFTTLSHYFKFASQLYTSFQLKGWWLGQILTIEACTERSCNVRSVNPANFVDEEADPRRDGLSSFKHRSVKNMLLGPLQDMKILRSKFSSSGNVSFDKKDKDKCRNNCNMWCGKCCVWGKNTKWTAGVYIFRNKLTCLGRRREEAIW